MPLRALALVTLLGACTSSTSLSEFAGADTAPLAVSIAADPPAGADGLFARDATVRIVLDDYPDPDTASFGPILLRSGRANFDIDVRVDLLDHAILLHPRTLMQPQTEYEVLVSPNVRALDGRAVGGRGAAFTFTTGDGLANPPPAPTYTWDDVAPALRKCAPTCHALVSPPTPSQPLGEPLLPQRSLAFDASPSDATLGLIRVPSLSQAGTAQPLARVTPGDGARSVLLRKLLGGNAHAASTDPPYPEMGVDGRRMPPDDPPLDDDTIRRIQQWIDGGAIIAQ